MNAIVGMTELALETKLSAEQREYLRTVKTSAGSLLDLINDILDFSKIEARKEEIDQVRFSLREALEDAIRVVALRAHQKGLELACHILPGVPDALVGDPQRLRRIIVNLAGNAVKFTDHGEVVVRVKLESSAESGVILHFAVADTGIGIAPENQQEIFEAFSQGAAKPMHKYGGTGLGLTISSQLTRLMGGKMWVESRAGAGSTFHFTAHFGLQSPLEAHPAKTAPLKLRNLPVLIADDNPTSRQILSEMIESWSMKPIAVDSGKAALEALEEAANAGSPFSLAILDAHMPEMDGFEVTKRARHDPKMRDTILFLLTSAGWREDADRMRQSGAAAAVTKPVKQSELWDAIVTALHVPGRQRLRATRLRTARRKKALRILVAEDNPVNQELVVNLLGRRGHSVTVVENGRLAVDRLEKEKFDIVLMDVQMPVMSGIEATQAIRSKEKSTGAHVPILAMTAHAMQGDRERCLAAGMDGYLSKPVQLKVLLQTVEGMATPGFKPSEISQTLPEGESFNAAMLRERFRGNQKLLGTLVKTFQEDCPKMMARIRAALASHETAALAQAAHALKGSVGNFGPSPAFETARKLEFAGRQGELAGVRDMYSALEDHIAHLLPALQGLNSGKRHSNRRNRPHRTGREKP
jgi:CheY-like chemotaxis protein